LTPLSLAAKASAGTANATTTNACLNVIFIPSSFLS
jgi:hypothetical protein